MKDYTSIISVLESYKRQSTKDRREFLPLIYDLKSVISQDNEKNKTDALYFTKLAHMTENYCVESKYVKYPHDEKTLLFNATVSFHYMQRYIDKMHKNIYTISDAISKKAETYTDLATQYNITIDDELEKIKEHINHYKNTDVYKEFDGEVNKKIDLLKELTDYLNNLETKSFKLSMSKEIPINSFYGQNYPTDFRKSPELAEFVVLLDKAKVEFSNYFVDNKNIADVTETFKLMDNVDEIFKSVHLKLRNAGYQSCLADMFADAPKDKSVMGVLKGKIEEDENIRVYELPTWASASKIFVFKDSSMLVKNNKDESKEVLSSKDCVEIRNRLINDYIHEEFKKKPTISRTFKQMNELVYLDSFDSLTRVVNTYKENEAILKLNEFDILTTVKENSKDNQSSYRIYEKVDDVMSQIVHDHKVKQFIHSIASNKYDHLYNEQTYKIASGLYDLKLPDNSLQEYVGKKIAAFKTPEQFNDALNTFLESLNSFEMRATLNKAEKFGVQVISENDNKVILRIDDFATSKTMGSSSWCISRDESYFKSYANGREQYFLFDFSKDNTDNRSMIGITLEKNGNYSAGHYKDDEECEEGDEEMIEYVQEAVYEYKHKLKENLENKFEQKERLKV
jgi:hypothetical protein